MRIATFNVNGINSRLPALLQWLEETQPDVACLQELKAPQEKFPEMEIRAAGYHPIWHGQKSWNGVAILARDAEPVEVGRGLPGDPDDEQSRYIEAAVNGILVACLYLPNGNPAPGPKFDYKLRWFERLHKRARELIDTGAPVVLCGDYNVMPTELDVYKPERWLDDALFRPETRASLPQAARPGLDRMRCANPSGRSHLHLLGLLPRRLRPQRRPAHRPPAAQPSLAPKLKAAGVDREVRGREKPSDHAPTWVELDWP
jgi:exodeoxyribonuclease-3